MYGKVRYEFEVWIDKNRGHMHDNPGSRWIPQNMKKTMWHET